MPGYADLPLHGGRVPPWMLRLMEKMAEAVASAIVEIHGSDAIVKGLSDPIWFQAFNNIIGMDWDSSGSTTVLLGVLKSVTRRRPDLGFLVLGGKGARMLKVPEEADVAERLLGVDAERVRLASKLAARLDSSFLQDGYDLYHHAVIVSSNVLSVIQQGMNASRGIARRYHLDRLTVEEPHSGVAGIPGGVELNATAEESREARRVYMDIIGEGKRRILRLLAEANRMLSSGHTLLDYAGSVRAGDEERVVSRPYYKPVRPSPQLLRAIERVVEYSPSDEMELAVAPGLGPSVVRALALIADLVLSVPTSTRDPVTHPLDPYLYAYAVGGKDGVPYPYDRRTAERVILTLEEAVHAARLGDRERLRALFRLRRILDRIRWRP